MRLLAAVPLLAAACGEFEDPAIVVDLRILAMTAEPPEQMVDPADPALVPVEICALLADPTQTRGLRWSMTLCPPQAGGRCGDDRPSLLLGEGAVEDPESEFRTLACAVVPPGPEVVAILRDTIEEDNVSGFAGIDLTVSLRVTPRLEGEDEAVYGAKSVRYSPPLPAERVANTNPRAERYAISEAGVEVDQLHPRRCARDGFPITVAPGEDLEIVPIEPDGVREDYVLPTFEGGSRRFTEYMTYQFLSTHGSWRRNTSGGPRDPAGNEPGLSTTFHAPPAEDIGADPLPVSVWVVQRDERGGGSWFESCVLVDPEAPPP